MLWRNVSLYVSPNMDMVWCNTTRLEFLAMLQSPMIEFFCASIDFSEVFLRAITFVQVSTWTGGCASRNRKIRTLHSLVWLKHWLCLPSVIMWADVKPVSSSIIKKLVYLGHRLLLKRVLLHLRNSVLKTCRQNLYFEQGGFRTKLRKLWDFHSSFKL